MNDASSKLKKKCICIQRGIRNKHFNDDEPSSANPSYYRAKRCRFYGDGISIAPLEMSETEPGAVGLLLDKVFFILSRCLFLSNFFGQTSAKCDDLFRLPKRSGLSLIE